MGAITTVTEAVEDHFRRCAATARRKFGLSVRPIYTADKQRRPTPVGSAVLIDIHGRHCVVTANHVLNHGELHIGAAGEIIPLHAAFVTSPGTGQRSDTIDVAVAALSDEQVRAMDNLPFIRVGDQMRATLDERRYLLAIGYRISQNKTPLNASREITSTRWSYTGMSAVLPDAERRFANGAFNFALNYGKKAVRESGERVRNTPPHGISGGPIFDLGDTSSVDQLCSATAHPPRLTGVVIECPSQGGVLIGTSVEVLRAYGAKAVENAK